ncbi:hypothetical protein ACFGYT_05575 [Pasteurella multocida]|nr:hypothetical protein [Pasteurella multocida]
MKEIDLIFDRGDDEFIVFNAKHKCKPVDVTSARFSMRIKPHEHRGDVIELSTDNGAITIAERTRIVIRVPKDTTQAMDAPKYGFSLRIEHGGYAKTIARGFITMAKGV